MDTDKTPYSDICTILGDLWLDYRGDDAFSDFIDYNDIGLPLAYCIAEGVVSNAPLAEQYIMETWELLLESLGVEDTGYESLEDLLESAVEEE